MKIKVLKKEKKKRTHHIEEKKKKKSSSVFAFRTKHPSIQHTVTNV